MPSETVTCKEHDHAHGTSFDHAVRTLDLRIVNPEETTKGNKDPFEAKREEILLTFLSMFQLNENLYSHLKEEKDWRMRADPLRHPLIFYYGHTAAFYINKLVLAKILKFNERVDPKVEALVSVGVDEMSWDDLLSDNYEWPSVKEMQEYRNKVRALVSKLIREVIPMPRNKTIIDWDHPFWPIIMGIEHERIHFETSSVLIRQLPLESLERNPSNIQSHVVKITRDGNQAISVFENACEKWSSDIEAIVKANKFLPVPGGKVHLGRPKDVTYHDNEDDKFFQGVHVPIYGWDNEYGFHEATVPDFKATERLITNAEYLAFVNDNSYAVREFWSQEGWFWVQYTKAHYPKFWVLHHGKATVPYAPSDFVQRNMLSQTQSMPWDWPVEVNCLEASAYCRWYAKKHKVNVRLPTEDEYARLRDVCLPNGTKLLKDSTDIFPFDIANLGLKAFSSSCPVDQFKHGDFYDVVGNVWQWTHTTMYPYEGFEVHPLYDDFTVPTYDDKHNLIKGQSWISAGNEATKYSRYAFRRHFFQHAGFRMVLLNEPRKQESSDNQLDFDHKNIMGDHIDKDQVDMQNLNKAYESDFLVSQYCMFHYGRPSVFIPNVDLFPLVCARVCEILVKSSEMWSQRQNGDIKRLRALDMGCAVGRSSFELARVFDEVVGVDLSARFIQVAYQLMEDNGHLRFSNPLEGEIMEYDEVILGSKRVPLDGSEGWSLVTKVFGKEIADKAKTTRDNDTSASMTETFKRLRFLQGDACNMSLTHPLLTPTNQFHVVLAANLVDRLYDPAKFLHDISQRITKGGYLVLCSPYTWLPDFTPKDKWLGGQKRYGENVYTKDGLEEVLSPMGFELVDLLEYRNKVQGHATLREEMDDVLMELTAQDHHHATAERLTSFHIPFVIRETKRKHQYTFSECTIWLKK